jgi:hypothetical protein
MGLLDTAAKERIHEASLSILEETGIQIDSEMVANTLQEHDIPCEVTGKQGDRTLWRVKAAEIRNMIFIWTEKDRRTPFITARWAVPRWYTTLKRVKGDSER